MTKKNLLAEQLNSFSETLKTSPKTDKIDSKIAPNSEKKELKTAPESGQELPQIPSLIKGIEEPFSAETNLPITLKNKEAPKEITQMSLLIPNNLRKKLKKFAFQNELKVNAVILEAIETYLSTSK